MCVWNLATEADIEDQQDWLVIRCACLSTEVPN